MRAVISNGLILDSLAVLDVDADERIMCVFDNNSFQHLEWQVSLSVITRLMPLSCGKLRHNKQ